MFVIVIYTSDYSDIMLAMDERFEVVTFKSKEEASQYAKDNCSSLGLRVVEI